LETEQACSKGIDKAEVNKKGKYNEEKKLQEAKGSK